MVREDFVEQFLRFVSVDCKGSSVFVALKLESRYPGNFNDITERMTNTLVFYDTTTSNDANSVDRLDNSGKCIAMYTSACENATLQSHKMSEC